ncbi:MAG: pseudouridine synthase [Bacteroidota bacterium]
MVEETKKSHRHFRLFKPYGYLSQLSSNAKHQANSKFISELYDFPLGTMPIGRLDKHSEGLILLATDGKLSHEVNSSGIEKEYYVQVDGIISEDALIKLREGVNISVNGKIYTTKKCRAIRLTEAPDLPARGRKIRDERHGPTSWVSITLTEGKFRQVRKMTSALGFPTLRLVRVRIGSIVWNGLEVGGVEEIALLQLSLS